MNILKISIGVLCVTSLSFSQISTDTVKKDAGIKISKTMTFQHVNVETYLENPGTIIITGSTLDDTMDLKLDRSFRQELSSNIDKETVERMF
ncbi:MAG: hypothetical protein ACM31E_00880 [Fibrobacterota bacterium]